MYEDVNDAQRLSADPVMRAVSEKKGHKVKTGLQNNGILAILFYEVNMRNIY